ncbi:MAG: hypothetical protein HS111_16405 [Kofleriaceae bacterium]|nr:hypothetical protein [Kofleriaceae bacterium]MCL4228857.1 hypothetical protein [Myxococcales bacterium]
MNLAGALADVEAAIASDRLDDAAALLGRVAAAMLARPPEPTLLARAAWLAGAVSLREGDAAAFATLSRDAVLALRLSGERALAAAAGASRDELLAHLEDVARVQTAGAAGLMAALEDRCALLLDVAASGGWDDPRWARIDRQRALLPGLIALVELTTGAPAPLARVLDELRLDPVECVLFVTLAPLSHHDAPIWPQRLARLCFRDWRAHDEALLRLRDDGRLARGQALAASRQGELMLAPALLAQLYAP